MKKLMKVLGGLLVVLVVVFGVAYMFRMPVVTFMLDTFALSDEFVGVTTDGTPREGLYRVAATGVSTEPVRAAAAAFLASLDEDLRRATEFPLEHKEWRRWANIHLYQRRGAGILDMTQAQKAAGYELLESALSPRGYAQVRDIMRLDTTLKEMADGDHQWYGEERFWFTVMGQPHASDPWGWQIDGHHLVINYFVLGDQVVMSPVFLGAEPVIATSGVHEGVAVLQAEQDAGLAFLLSLSEEHRAQAVISETKSSGETHGELFSDNAIVPYQGLNAGRLDADDQRALLALAELFIGHMSAGHAEIKMVEVASHLDETYFTWIGGAMDTSTYYYRIQSPVVMIEFDHQGPIGLSHLTEDQGPQRNHIHVTIRTPNGNDYGKDLLRQHLRDHEASHARLDMTSSGS